MSDGYAEDDDVGAPGTDGTRQTRSRVPETAASVTITGLLAFLHPRGASRSDKLVRDSGWCVIAAEGVVVCWEAVVQAVAVRSETRPAMAW